MFNPKIGQNFFLPKERSSRIVFFFMALGFWEMYMTDPCEERESQIMAAVAVRAIETNTII